MSNPAGPADPPNPPGSESETEAIETTAETEAPDTIAADLRAEPPADPPERRFTAPGFDAGSTEIMTTMPDPATEVIATAPPPPQQQASSPKAPPQLIPPRLAGKLPAGAPGSWGWVLALILVILALAAIVVLGTVWFTRSHESQESQEDQVRDTILKFNSAIQRGNLTTLRSITCGRERDNYVNYDDSAFSDAYQRIAAGNQYPVVGNITEVVVNGDHAEANVTAFKANAPDVTSTRSFDLQYVDGQWKICQTNSG